ncbi:MAG: dipeptide epimerase [Verrucomicrobia bacterium]|nr:MAG: dipeptide epimerase [Verrucomicrobiota bacterium]
MKLTVHPYAIPLRHPFRIAHGEQHHAGGLLVALEADGITGWGEAPAVGHYGATLERLRAGLEGVRAVVEKTPPMPPERFWERLRAVLPDDAWGRFVLCALDEAMHDWWGRAHDQPTWRLWGLEADRLPVSNYTVGLDSIERMAAKIEEFADWPVFKIKLDRDHGLEVLEALRARTDAVFRVDANCAWSARRTLELMPGLKRLGVELVEQPLAPDDWEGMRRVRAGRCLPVIADESCQTEADVARCAAVFDGINVKLTKAGGLTPARRMLEEARRLCLRRMAGCMVETSVGIAALAQLLPLLDWVDMDGALLLAGDVAEGVRLERGRPVLPEMPGNGATIRPDWLVRFGRD